MRASSTKSATPVDWYYYLRQNFKPQKLEKALLSKTRAESEKEYIINMVPKSYSSQCIEIRQLESKLEHAGCKRISRTSHLTLLPMLHHIPGQCTLHIYGGWILTMTLDYLRNNRWCCYRTSCCSCFCLYLIFGCILYLESW